MKQDGLDRRSTVLYALLGVMAVGIVTQAFFLYQLGIMVDHYGQQVSALQNDVSTFVYRSQYANYLHSAVVNSGLEDIGAGEVLSGYVGNWTAPRAVRVMRVQVWMGNPYGVTWEGDVHVTKNASGSFWQGDSLLAHYQFDKHAESPVPHQLMFDLSPGYRLLSGESIYVWRAFHNTSPGATKAGDAQVIIYYVPDTE